MTIKVGEIREIDKDNEKVEIVEFGGLEIKVNQYLPIQTKRTIAETIVHASFVSDKETGLNRFDRGLAEATWGYLIIKHYTNINTMKDPFAMYDSVKGNNILKAVELGIDNDEMGLLVEMVRNRISEAFRVEQASMQIGFKLEGLVDVLVSKMSESLETLQNFDTEDLKTMTGLIKVDADNTSKDNLTDLTQK